MEDIHDRVFTYLAFMFHFTWLDGEAAKKWTQVLLISDNQFILLRLNEYDWEAGSVKADSPSRFSMTNPRKCR